MAKAKSALPAGFHTVTPTLTYANAARAIDWLTKALGAKEVSKSTGPDGKILHADVQIGNSHIMLHDAMMGAKGPRELGGSPVSLWLYVEDCDALFKRALGAGGRPGEGPMGQMQDQFWGDRCGAITDPEGYTWNIATRKEDLSPQEMKQRQDEWMRKFAEQEAHA